MRKITIGESESILASVTLQLLRGHRRLALLADDNLLGEVQLVESGGLDLQSLGVLERTHPRRYSLLRRGHCTIK
jgi:hypothetical protein